MTPQCPAAHSWLIVSLYMRALFYFRGSLQFGALMYMVIDVFKSVIPFLLLLLVVTFGFSFGIALLIQHTTYRYPDYSDTSSALWTMFNAGFRFVPPELAATQTRWQIVLLYGLFLCFVQARPPPLPQRAQRFSDARTNPGPNSIGAPRES